MLKRKIKQGRQTRSPEGGMGNFRYFINLFLTTQSGNTCFDFCFLTPREENVDRQVPLYSCRDVF